MTPTTLDECVRPTTIDEVIGQSSAKKLVQSVINSGERRCLLFFGPPGTGKTTLARIVGRGLQGPDFPADGEPDVLEINAADFAAADGIRDLVRNTQSVPFQGKYRVIILDEAHQLSITAQNVLLKPFEERNSINVWIICTTDPEKLIPALRTRCTTIKLEPLSPKERVELIKIANGVLFPPDVNSEGESLEKFIEEVQNQELSLPRDIMKAMQTWHDGLSAREAVELRLPRRPRRNP